MSELKTRKTGKSVARFIAKVEDEQQRKDCEELVEIMSKITGAEAELWGENIVGFGSYTYRYATGREGDWFLTGFAPRKQNLSIYFMSGFGILADHLENLGKHAKGKSCLYVKNLDQVHRPTLKKMIRDSVNKMKKNQKR